MSTEAGISTYCLNFYYSQEKHICLMPLANAVLVHIYRYILCNTSNLYISYSLKLSHLDITRYEIWLWKCSAFNPRGDHWSEISLADQCKNVPGSPWFRIVCFHIWQCIWEIMIAMECRCNFQCIKHMITLASKLGQCSTTLFANICTIAFIKSDVDSLVPIEIQFLALLK